MDVREKLVELANNVLRYFLWGEIQNNTAERIADRMMDHGVTVQEWISVDDRLPDNSATVNLCTRSKIVGTGFYNKYTKSWVQYYSGGAICVDVTHWQPMPQPPKGE